MDRPQISTSHERAWAEVDLDALRGNIEALRHFSGNRAILVLAKANAYGHGAIEVAKAAVAAGASILGVADVHEGMELRSAGIDAPILVLGPTLPDEIPFAIAHRLQLCLSPIESLPAIVDCAHRAGRSAEVHLMVDTGMSRNGISHEEAVHAAQICAEHNELDLVGLATHFIESESVAGGLVDQQLDEFQRTIDELSRNNLLPPLLHAANSCAVLGHPRAHFNLVRPGIAVYGMKSSSRRFAVNVRLSPVISVKARVTLVREVAAGTTVGYGATYRTPDRTRIATIPIGYADGWPTSLSNRGDVLLRGTRVPIVGRISMDCMTVNIGRELDVNPGDVVTLLGRDGDEEITAEELAGLSGRIPYEVTCGLGRRIRHHYLNTPCPTSEKPSRAAANTFSLASSS